MPRTPRELRAWAKKRTWHHELVSAPLRYELDVDIGVLVCVTRPGYAECHGPDDPVCGLARFSVHGCNDAPSRQEYLAYLVTIRRGSDRVLPRTP